jgi:hypothetical protein
MGNIIVSDTGGIKNSVLKDIISDWAINDYDAGLGKLNNSKIKQLLKKRACCTRQTDMRIALPTIDLTKESVNSFSNNYTKIKIKIFNDDNDLKNNCNIEDDDYIDDTDYKLPDYFASGGPSATQACQILYEGDGQYITGLCGSIKEDRTYQTNDPNIIAYGIYDDDRLNVYQDCNCLNSVLRNDVSIHSTTQGKLELSSDNIVQQFDKRCTFVHDAAYKVRDITDQKLCINQTITGNINASQQSVINFNQSNSGCSPEDTMNVTVHPNSFINLPSISTSTSSSPTSSTSNITKSTSGSNKNTPNIILTIVLIIVILLMFGIYKYFVH